MFIVFFYIIEFIPLESELDDVMSVFNRIVRIMLFIILLTLVLLTELFHGTSKKMFMS